MELPAMNCFSQQILYPAGGSGPFFFHGLPVSEPVDDYMTGVDILCDILDELCLLYVGHSDNAAIFDSAAFATEMADPMPLQLGDEMDETGGEDGEEDVYIIDADDEMDIVYETDDTTPADFGDAEAMDIVKVDGMDGLGDIEMVIDS
jgi:hypothetical protein